MMLLNIKSPNCFEGISCHPTHQMYLIVPHRAVSLSSKLIRIRASNNKNMEKPNSTTFSLNFTLLELQGSRNDFYSRRGTKWNACCDLCTSAEPSKPHNLHFGIPDQNSEIFSARKAKYEFRLFSILRVFWIFPIIYK